MDLTGFMHGDEGSLEKCTECGVTVRSEERAAQYENDTYDHELLEVLYPRYRDAFRRKERGYKCLLRPRAEVLEVGSHLGAFLEVGEEWGWHPTGVDVGWDTTRFARKRGARVLRGTIETVNLPAYRADAVFAWNCFEQLENPTSALAAAHRLLKRHGLLVVRTPNIAFYYRARAAWRAGVTRQLRSLAYNNLLGFTYLAGYDPGTLSEFLRSCGFDPLLGFNSSIIVVPYPDITPRLKLEIESLRPSFADTFAQAPAELKGPWIEILARKRDA